MDKIQPTATYPEIASLSLKDVQGALHLGRLNYDGVKEEYRPELDARLAALEARRLELITAAGGLTYRCTNQTRLAVCHVCRVCHVFEANRVKPAPFTTRTAMGREWQGVQCFKCGGALYQTTHLTKKPKHTLDGTPIGRYGYHVGQEGGAQ